MTFFAIIFSVPMRLEMIIPQPNTEASLTWILARAEGNGKLTFFSETRIFDKIFLACDSSMEDIVL